jgi:hypothetical protein
MKSVEDESVRMDDRSFSNESFAALTGNIPLGWQRRLYLEHLIENIEA